MGELDAQVRLAVAAGKGAVYRFDEHPLAVAGEALRQPPPARGRQRAHGGAALGLDRFRYRVGQARGARFRARRVAEGVDVAEVDRFAHRQGAREVVAGFAREADHDVGGEVGRHAAPPPSGADAVDQAEVAVDIVLAAHAQQDAVGTALQAQVQVRAQAFVAGQFDEAVVERIRFERGDAYPVVAGQREQLLQQAAEGPVGPPVAADVDAGEHQFAVALVEQAARFIEDVGGGPAERPAAYRRDDAEGAEVVAAVLDLDGGAGMQGLRAGPVAERIGRQRCRVHYLAGQVRRHQIEDLALAGVVHGVVDAGQVAGHAALGGDVATGGDDQGPRVHAFAAGPLAAGRRFGLRGAARGAIQGVARLAVGLTGDGASVDHYHVGRLGSGDYPVAGGDEARRERVAFGNVEPAAEIGEGDGGCHDAAVRGGRVRRCGRPAPAHRCPARSGRRSGRFWRSPRRAGRQAAETPCGSGRGRPS